MWWTCCLVVCYKYFMVYTCHRVYGICTHNPFISRFSPIRHSPPPSDTLLRFLCGASPQECAQAPDDSDLDPALSTRALSLHFWDWDQALGEGRALCSEWDCVTWTASWGQRRCSLLLCTWGLTRRAVWSEGKCGKVPCWSLCGSWPSCVPPETVGTADCLFHMVRSSLCVWLGHRKVMC